MRNQTEMKSVMQELIAREIKRLASLADICVFAQYDPMVSRSGPVDYVCHDKRDFKGGINLDVHYEFEGIGVWYIVTRHGDVFDARKILLHIRDGRFINGQMGDFEGYWEDFPQYVAEDRWVRDSMALNGPIGHVLGPSWAQEISEEARY